MENKLAKSTLIVYECESRKFNYVDSEGDFFAQVLEKDFLEKIEEIAQADAPVVQFEECYVKRDELSGDWYRVGFVCPVPGETIQIIFTNIDEEKLENCSLTHVSDFDRLTGLLSRPAFVKVVETTVEVDAAGIEAGEYALVFFDIIRFKVINDLFGMEEGDRLLKYIADVMVRTVKEEDAVCRMNADRFILLTHNEGAALERLVEAIVESVTAYDLPYKINCNVGVYVTNNAKISAESMIDRAVLAQSSIKGSYISKYNYYTESMRNDMLSEQEISGIMLNALLEKQFVVYYQPQYNHSTGMLVGAEALVRWMHPDRGMISPGIFIPIFEKNGFITRLDLYVFEEVCIFLRKCMDEGLPIVPVSSNFARYDIFQPNFVEKLEALREKYQIPSQYLRVEITESAIMGGSKHANEIVHKLHDCGYVVEMDDFGSGYSSLNVLKDIELDIIKLDMLFMKEDSDSKRGGTILSSIVRMAKWLGMPVIAEGVEHLEQADFLKSIGCDYIQGYLYSKPLPEAQYLEILDNKFVGKTLPQMNLLDTLNTYDFWNPKSQETLIFSNYVGGAAIFDYHDGQVEVLRVNKKYLQELCMNLTEKDLIDADPMRFFDEANKRIYFDMLKRAIETEDEQECETWRDIVSDCCGGERICVRTTARVIGKSDNNYLFYAMIRNVTAEKHHYAEILESERRFKMASEQANIYYWEYDVATHEMRSCFRCMRDLGFPAVLANYPDSAIDMGIFPPEVADMYRDWHRQIEAGVEHLEAVIPLTVGRVPFHVRYTTEFDENGRAVKAYGSATLVVS